MNRSRSHTLILPYTHTPIPTVDATATLVFPHQLFGDHPALPEGGAAVLVEDSLFFRDPQYPARYHKQRLLLHRASMRRYADRLAERGHAVRYEAFPDHERVEDVVERLAEDGVETLRYADPHDFTLQKRLDAACERLGVEQEVVPSPMWLNTRGENAGFFEGRKRWVMASFYKEQRRRLGVLVDGDGEPAGGQWSFDEKNRKPITEEALSEVPPLPEVKEDDYVREARAYVEEHFGDHYGSTEQFCYPTSHAEAGRWLDHFLHHRLAAFGPFEDAFEPGRPYLYHAVLTPALNTGLLTAREVVDRTLDFAAEHAVPLQSLEGFLRQVIGWREYIRAAYDLRGVELRTGNEWGFERDLPPSFYDGTTGLPPVDDAIRRCLDLAYAHHIERLMVLGGVLFLSRIHPDAVYRWFMELFIDAYDWVMVPNTYGMSQHAAGEVILTKPYFSGSNYILKMSHYERGPWCDTWDGLFWQFIFDYAERLRGNPRWAMIVSQAGRMKAETRERHERHAQAFFDKLDRELAAA
ncbi:MAG: cryptochrome/photolyase family protein [Bacteroidota bacterium]